MNITRETIKSTLRTIMAEETEYQTFFKKALEKAGKSIPSMSDEEKKEFFNKIDAAWNAKGEKKEVTEVHLREGMKKWKVDFKHTDGSKRTVDIEAFDKKRAEARFKVNWGNDMKILKIYPAPKNEELKGNQHKLDVDGDGEIEASDLAALRAGNKKDESIEESTGCSCGCGGCSESVNEARTVSKPIKVDDDTMVQIVGDNKGFRELTAALNPKTGKPIQKFGYERGNEIADSKEELIKKLQKKYGKSIKFESVNEAATDRDFEKVYSIFDKKDYFNAKGLAKTQIGNFERALQRNDKGAQQILDKFNGDMEKSKEYIIQVISDQKKQQAFEDFKALKAAVDSIQKGKPITGAVDLVKSRAHNNSQKYTMALYSALRGKKFNNYKDIHSDVDSLIGESITEGRAFVQAARKAKEEGKTEFEFNGKTYPVTLKEEVNEARLGKVSLLKSVEKGETSRVEGVKISPELAFELRMFLQRPMLARTRTGIAIDNSQMKDAIPMLAKVGVHKRLSSVVKKEFADLLKKYNK